MPNLLGASAADQFGSNAKHSGKIWAAAANMLATAYVDSYKKR
jgi:hypothetical protein